MYTILGVEDGPFSSRKKGKALLVGALIAPGFIIKGLLLTYIQVDGLDATDRLINMIRTSREKIDLVMLSSIPYAGFNLMDPTRINSEVKLPVIVVNPEKPNEEAVKRALKSHFEDWEERMRIIEKTGPPFPLQINERKVLYFNAVGISKELASKIIKGSIVVGYKPEPLRVARLIARGLGPVLEAC